MTELPARWRMPLAGATVCAVLAAIVIVLREDSVPPPAAPAGTVTDQPMVLVLRAVDFVDERHWFGVQGLCQETDARRCSHTLLESEQGRLRFRELPAELRGQRGGTAVGVTVLGPERLLVQSDPGRRWYSADRGQHWAEVGPDAPPVGEIPANGFLERYCEPAPGCTPKIMVTLPDSGRRAELRGVPPLTEVVPHTRFADADGRWRLVGRRADKPVLAGSADRGRSWQVSELPPGPPGQLLDAEVALSGRSTYLRLTSRTPEREAKPATALYREDGARWQLVWRSDPAGPEPRSLTGVLPRPGGQLAATDEQGDGWVSADGGRTFQPARPEDQIPRGWPRRARTGYLAEAGNTLSHSPDGVRWTPLPNG
ncbi:MULTISPECIES: hypothetical protein [unclassified Crossiella]|uniref:hypothetical protein n=1 Tax=unclassified Crossiella TaxID=2620835 RepID=UPI0020005064|nr:MULTISPECIES: hypothetical protein [unclassified Crossiella]MCK2239702.1 hypothetical protein [Crossiella sp. S99.2]MCK2252397.1 hypothetical protein [Crossiella sp. S99.1]